MSVESDTEKAFRLLNTSLFRSAIINNSYHNLDLDDEATRREFLRIAEDPIMLRYFEEMVLVRRKIPLWFKFRNNGDPEGNHWNISAPPTKQNESSTSNHNEQPSASNISQSVSEMPPTNSSEANTSTQNVQPTTSISLQTVSSAPTTNSSEPNTSNHHVPTTDIDYQNVPPAPPIYSSDPNASHHYAQQTTSNYYQPALMPQAPTGAQFIGYQNELVPLANMDLNVMNHPGIMQYHQAAPVQGVVQYVQPFGMMVPSFPTPNVFPNGMAAPNNSQPGYWSMGVANGPPPLMEVRHQSNGYGNYQQGYSGHAAPPNNTAFAPPNFNGPHYSRPSHFQNHGRYNGRRGSYSNRPPRGGRKPWVPREQIGNGFRRPAESYNRGPFNAIEQSHQMYTMAPGTSQYAELEKQIGVALDRAFAAYPDKEEPCGSIRHKSGISAALEHNEGKSNNGEPSSSTVAPDPVVQQNKTEIVARNETPALSEISSRALSVASAAVSTAEKNRKIGDDSPPSTSATVSSQENVPDTADCAENVADSSKTKSELQETPILTSSSFRDAVLRNRMENGQRTTQNRSDVPPKQQTDAHISKESPSTIQRKSRESPEKVHDVRDANNSSRQVRSAVAQKSGRTSTNRYKGKPPVTIPVPAPTTTAIVGFHPNSRSTATDGNESVSQIVKKKPPPPVLVIKNKFSHLSSAQEDDEESVENTTPETTDDNKVDVTPKPARKPRSGKKKGGKASEKAKKKQKKNAVPYEAAAEKKKKNEEAEPEKKADAVAFASEEEVLKRDHPEESPENREFNNAKESVEAVVGLTDGAEGGRDEDVAVDRDTHSVDTEEEELNAVICPAEDNSKLHEAEEGDGNGVGEKPEKSKKSKSKKKKKPTKESETVAATQLAIPEESRSRFYVEEPVPQDHSILAVDYANSAIDRFQSCIEPPPGVRLASSYGTPSGISSGLRTVSLKGLTNPMAVMIDTDNWQKRVKKQVKGRLMYFSKYVTNTLEKSIPEWEGNIPFLDKKERDFKRRERDQRLKGFLKRQANRTNEKYINFIGYTMMWFYRILSETYITEMGPMLSSVGMLESRGAEFDAEEWRVMKLILDNASNTDHDHIALTHPEFYLTEQDLFF